MPSLTGGKAAKNMAAALGAGLVLLSAPLTAETEPVDFAYEVVEFSGGETLREFVATHLNDPDLWPTVLKINQLLSPADLTPGAMVFMPIRQVALADTALLSSLSAIQIATAEGARLFAPRQIGDAIDNRDIAVQRREVGEWREVLDFSDIATGHANDALEITVAQRDRAAEALITDIHGDVEGRDPAEQAWSNRVLDDILVEYERLRTLSNSTTQVTFRDLSRLRLNPNSNATIQSMRSDPLTGKEVTKVSLSNGDFYALLNQLSTEDEFEIDVQGIETKTDSTDFWVKNDNTGARFVNYDQAALEITTGQDRVTLGQNQGVVISDGEATVRAAVLDRASLSAPIDGATLYGGSADLSWLPFEGAAGFWIELASDPGFNHMMASKWGLRDTGFVVDGLDSGDYFWRVAALDMLGLPGTWSQTASFSMRFDSTPPFLTILSPATDTLTEASGIEIFGATEKNVAVLINGRATVVGGDGSFFETLPLNVGANTIVIEAIDLADNVSRKATTVTYRPVSRVDIVLDAKLARVDGALVSRTSELAILGRGDGASGGVIVATSGNDDVIARADINADGSFILSVPADIETATYTLAAHSPNGTIEGHLAIDVRRDMTPPLLGLDLPPPAATRDEVLTLSGQIEQGASLELGGKPVAVSEGRFDISVPLAQGENHFELRARDAAGNTTLLTARTLFDRDPPDIISADAFRANGTDGPIEIVVAAQDISGLRQAAHYLIEVGDNEYEGLLRCDAALSICRAVLAPEKGDLTLVEVIVQDYAGNEAFR